MRTIKRGTLLTVLLSLGLWVRAEAIAITPSIQAFELLPGEKVESQITVANTEEETLQVVPVMKTWFELKENKGIKVSDWLEYESAASFSLKPGESKTLRFHVRAPKKAVGELIGMLSFRTKSPTRTSVEFVMSSAVYLALKGTEKLKGQVAAFTVTPSSSQLTAGILVRNAGNVHLRPYGILQILDSKDQPYANVELEKGQPVYPGQQRAYMGTIKDFTLKPGQYTAVIGIEDNDRNVTIDSRREKFTVAEDFKVRF